MPLRLGQGRLSVGVFDLWQRHIQQARQRQQQPQQQQQWQKSRHTEAPAAQPDPAEQKQWRKPVDQVVGQLGRGKGKEEEDKAKPDQQEPRQWLAPPLNRHPQPANDRQGKRQGGEQQHRQIEPEPALVPLHRIAETATVVGEEEALEKAHAVLQILHQIPGGRHQQEQSPGTPVDQHRTELTQPAARQAEQQRHRTGDQ